MINGQWLSGLPRRHFGGTEGAEIMAIAAQDQPGWNRGQCDAPRFAGPGPGIH
ncbi:MAG TPA: hypothetical protein VGJ09_13530 [Bryobacteraceae bacterium]